MIMAHYINEIDAKLDKVLELVDQLKIDTPKLSRVQAKRFMCYGESKFKFYEMKQMIIPRIDQLGKKYYLRHELLKVLESERTTLLKRAV
jgi:hypothetical protein